MIYLILIMHWVADFIFQNDRMAQNKSASFRWLSSHVFVYTICLLPFGPLYAVVNGAVHFMVDAVTSRCTSRLWKKGDRHNFFVVVGLDQLLHVIILISSMPLIGWSL